MDARQLELVASGFPSTQAATDDLHAELAPAGSGVVQFEVVTKFLDDCPGRPRAFKWPSRFPSEIRGGFAAQNGDFLPGQSRISSRSR